MSAVPEEKGSNAQTVVASGQGQVKKEESGGVPSQEICAPLTEYLTSSFHNVDSFAWHLLMSFDSANESILGMRNRYKERIASLHIANSLGEIEELRSLLGYLSVKDYNKEFFEDPDNVKRYADIVSRLAVLYNNFTAGKITNYGDFIFDLATIKYELESLLIEAIGIKTPAKQGNK
jgi:hypothetical protein